MTPQSQLIFDKSNSVCLRTEECKNHSHTLKLKNSEVIFIIGCWNSSYMCLNSFKKLTLMDLPLQVELTHIQNWPKNPNWKNLITWSKQSLDPSWKQSINSAQISLGLWLRKIKIKPISFKSLSAYPRNYYVIKYHLPSFLVLVGWTRIPCKQRILKLYWILATHENYVAAY
jgi:hypothetical protein